MDPEDSDTQARSRSGELCAFGEILETNNPPPESQIPSLRDFISRALARATCIDAEIATLQSAIDKLLSEREALNTEVQKHKGAISPLRRLPTEMLSLIFTFALAPRQDSISAPSAPWTISAVCARWRTTAISQPCFWTSIKLKNHPFISRRNGKWPPPPPSEFSLELQLDRSKELPLNIEFVVPRDRALSSFHASLLRLLCDHCGRWERMVMVGPQELFLRLGVFIDGGPLSCLRELKIQMFYDEEEEEDIIPTLDVFRDAPVLQHVVVNKSDWWLPVSMVLPWAQLLTYSGSNTWDEHLLALGSTSNLVECTLEIRGISDIIPQTSIILLPHLLRLSLSNPA
ncbi:hypothetical protein B0H16DRAFT_1018744, partial [Mycena metata]